MITMAEIDLLSAIGQIGFPMAVAAFLLYKGYTQDKEYLAVLTEIKTAITEIRQELRK